MKYIITITILAILATMMSCNDDHVMNKEEETVMQDVQKKGVDMPVEEVKDRMEKARNGESYKDDIFKVVEQMPRFPGCDDLSGEEANNCAQDKMLRYIYENITYPAEARKNGVEGGCVVSFIVERDGTLSDLRLIKDIGSGCGEEAKRVIASMNDLPERWQPGIQRGKKVRVQFNLPVLFKLEK